MDTKFQTSFIPKKPLLADQKMSRRSGGTSILMFIAILIFIASIAGAAYSVLWKNVLITAREGYKEELDKAEKKFDPVLIDKLRKANIKLDLTKKLLSQHLAVSEIFSIIGGLTVDGVKFTSFDFSGAGGDTKDSSGVKISMKGIGDGFSTIAYQSDVFGESEKFGKNIILKNPILSDLNLDEKGKVSFSFSATLVSEDISYEKSLQ